MSSGQYGYKFILDGTTDITDKIASFTIQADLEMYCRELSFEIYDEDLYDSFIFSEIPETPSIEVFTRVVELSDEYDDEYDPSWISQGTFYIERPTFKVGTDVVSLGIWGRQSTAILGEPFAQKVTKLWASDTTFFAICQEILESVGMTWNPLHSEIQDFAIYADNFEADDQFPIEVLKSLVELAIGAEGFVTSDREGNIWIKRLDRDPSSADYNITDLVVQSINEEPEWPTFGNRIKIIPAESVSQDKVEIYTDRECIGSEGPVFIDIYGQVSNGEGAPINNTVVTWSFDPLVPRSLWYKYSNNIEGKYKTALQNTSRILVSKELQKATGNNSVSVRFNAESVVGIWAYADVGRLTNFAPVGGYTVDGKNIIIIGDGFTYCDQAVFVSYYASGMVKNTIVYEEGTEPENVEDVLGTVIAIASVSGRESSKEIYVDNPCKCVTTLTTEVIYPETGGPPPPPPPPVTPCVSTGAAITEYSRGYNGINHWIGFIAGPSMSNQFPGCVCTWHLVAGEGGLSASSTSPGVSASSSTGFICFYVSPPLARNSSWRNVGVELRIGGVQIGIKLTTIP